MSPLSADAFWGERPRQFGAALLALALVAQAPAPVDTLRQREQELEAIRAEQSKAAEAEARLKAEIAAIADDRRQLAQQLIDTASRIREVESRIAAAEARLQPLDDSERAIRKSLDGRRGLIVEVLAALQRIGRHPPPALIVRPEDAVSALRSAMMLGAVLPEMRQEMEALAGDLTDLVRIRGEIADERERLSRDWRFLSEDQRRMHLLVEERQRQHSDTEKALDMERQRVLALARQVDNLKDLIAKLEQGLDAATRAARAAARTEEGDRPNLAALKDPGRLSPAIAFASAKGSLPLPVNGVKIREFGSPDGVGGSERGLAITTRAGAQVTAPCDGWVVYAGHFRSYGQLLILNAGGGYHVLLAGMERISVNPGQFVLTGEPVALMGSNSHMAAVLATGSSQPVLYVEFRKDGTPIDPSPWWAASESEKVRG
jgi:murein hydrolase activator